MILADDGVVLVDFGVARAIGSDETRRHDRGRHAALHGARGVRGRHRLGRERHLQPRRDAVDADHRRAAALRRRDEDREGRADARRRSCARRSPAAWRCCPRCGSRPRSPSPRRSACRSPYLGGESLAQSLGRAPVHRRVIEAIVRTAAGMFEAAAASIALTDQSTGELVYEAAWGAGASEVVGMRLPPGRRASPAPSWRAARRSRCRNAARTRASPPRSPPRPATCPTRCSSRRSCARAGRSAPSRCSTAATAGPYRHEDLAPRGAVRRPRGRRARPRHVPAVDDGRPDAAAGLTSLADRLRTRLRLRGMTANGR